MVGLAFTLVLTRRNHDGMYAHICVFDNRLAAASFHLSTVGLLQIDVDERTDHSDGYERFECAGTNMRPTRTYSNKLF